LIILIILIILIKQEIQMKEHQQDASSESGCCRVESVVTVDERGQMVLPKEIRDRAGIRAGDKLAIVGWEKDGEVCCMTLIKAEQLGDLVRPFLGTVMRGLGS
jgi:AbrB family looped-hinge helix DNA binding protein